MRMNTVWRLLRAYWGPAVLSLAALAAGGCKSLGSSSPANALNPATGTMLTSTCDAACQARPAADAQELVQARTVSSAEESRVQGLIDERAAAVRALDKAISDFTNRRPPSAAFDAASPARTTLHDLQTLRNSIAGAPLSEVDGLYNKAKGLLDDAYDVALRIGMFDPYVVGQRSANETWWSISS